MLEDDLVDTCKPGGRISVVGVYKAVPPRATGAVSGVFKAVVVGNSVRQLSRESDRDLTADDIRCASSAEAPVPAQANKPSLVTELLLVTSSASGMPFSMRSAMMNSPRALVLVAHNEGLHVAHYT